MFGIAAPVQTNPVDNCQQGYRCAILLDKNGHICEVIHNVPDMNVEIHEYNGNKHSSPGRPVFDFAVKAARKLMENKNG